MNEKAPDNRPRLNRDWHLANPMPKKPTQAQRLAWHLAHEANCACRPMPAGMRAALSRSE